MLSQVMSLVDFDAVATHGRRRPHRGHMSTRLQKDVDLVEEAELHHLEGDLGGARTRRVVPQTTSKFFLLSFPQATSPGVRVLQRPAVHLRQLRTEKPSCGGFASCGDAKIRIANGLRFVKKNGWCSNTNPTIGTVNGGGSGDDGCPSGHCAYSQCGGSSDGRAVQLRDAARALLLVRVGAHV